MHPEKSPKMLIILSVLILTLVSISRAGSDVKTINTARLHSMIVDNAYKLEAGREKQFMVIDARTKEEYYEAHIFSAVSIPERDFEKTMYLLPKDKSLLMVVYDNDINSGTRLQWAGKAAKDGYTNVVIYSEGFQVWKERLMPVTLFKESP